MKGQYIYIGTVENAIRLVNITDKCDFGIDIGDGNILVDGKSLFGIVNLNMARPWKIFYSGENDALESFIRQNSIKKAS